MSTVTAKTPVAQERRKRSAGWRWGKLGEVAKFIDRLSSDLREAFLDMKGLSPRNIKYMGPSPRPGRIGQLCNGSLHNCRGVRMFPYWNGKILPKSSIGPLGLMNMRSSTRRTILLVSGKWSTLVPGPSGKTRTSPSGSMGPFCAYQQKGRNRYHGE